MNLNFQFPTPKSQGTWCRSNLLGSWKLGVGISFALVITTTAAGSWHATQGDVSVKCPMTIGGSFDAKTAALSGTLTTSAAQPSLLDGSLAVDLRTIDTGI